MAFIETPNVARVAIRGRLFNNDVVNTLWFERTDEGEYVSGDLEDLCGAVYDWSVAGILPNLSHDYTIADITATAQWTATAPSHVFVPGFVTEGELLSDSETSSNCFTITFLTNARGRSYRGRNYISGLSTSHVAENMISASTANALRDAYVELNTFTTPVTSQHVVVSHYHDGASRPFGVTVPVTGYRYHDLNIDSQRRRLNGRGS